MNLFGDPNDASRGRCDVVDRAIGGASLAVRAIVIKSAAKECNILTIDRKYILLSRLRFNLPLRYG